MEKSWMPTVAGVLCIISACFALLGFLLLATFGLVFFNAPDVDLDDFPLAFIQVAFAIGALGSLAVGSTAIFGGVACLQRRRWGWCLAGAVSATLICPPLGVAAIILIVLSEDELRRPDS